MNDEPTSPILPVLNAIVHRVTNLAFTWDQSQKLYADETSIVVINKCAGGFFAILQELFVDSIFLQLAVLADPAKSGHFDNVSFAALLDEIRPHADPGFVTDLDHRIAGFTRLTKVICTHRNKRIAHADKAILIDGAGKLEGITIGDLRRAVDSTFDIVNCVLTQFARPSNMFEGIMVTGGADVLIGRLQMSQEWISLESWLLQEDHSGKSVDELVKQIRMRYVNWRRSIRRQA